MILIIIISLILGVFICILLKKKTKKYSSQYFNKIPNFLNINLNLEESIEFLEIIRLFSIELIDLSQKDIPNQAFLKSITNKLLGYILKIPRPTESSHHDITNILYYINEISDISTQVQTYLLSILPNLDNIFE